MNIALIGDAISLILSTWKSGNTLFAHLVAVLLALCQVTGLTSNPLIHSVYTIATDVENALADLQTSGYAIAGEDSVGGVLYSVIVVRNDSTVGQQFGIAPTTATAPATTDGSAP